MPHRADKLSQAERERLTAIVCPPGAKCWLCKKTLRRGLRRMHPDGPSLDHVIPASRGGTWELSNLRPCCVGCNSGRRDRAPRVPRGRRSSKWADLRGGEGR